MGVRTTGGPRPANSPVAAAGTTLSYHGGKLVQNPRVFQLRYGSGTYIPQLTSTTAPNMGTAYSQMLTSGVFDWLDEYNASSPSQLLGRGFHNGSTQITPEPTRNGSTITDAAIRAELTAQITAGNLPQPNDNQIYMVSFPAGKTITAFGDTSCVDFCAYHDSFQIGSQNVYYGVLPDLTTGGCATGCGAGTVFENQQSVASHEMIETITDGVVGTGWTSSGEEIGDLCNHQHASFVGTDGNTYTIQNEFSNQDGACIATRSTPPLRNPASDILWRDTDGTIAIWFENGGSAVSQIHIANPGLDWVIQSTGDFDGDGQTDILWRNQGSGVVQLWLMNGGTIVSQPPAINNPGFDWVIQRTGDFDGDGKTDILWRNQGSGVVQLWLMNGGTIASQPPPINNPGFDWVIQRTGDFDGDGKTDILWRNHGSGVVQLWLMNGGTIVSQPPPINNPGLDWVIQGTGDFDHDGKSDILWRDSDGTVAVWFMNAGALVGQVYPLPPTATVAPGLDWQIQGVGKFD
jgi:hypothetical protein